MGNVFPMNVMGQLDDGYFGFGLKDARSPSTLVNRTRRIALSTIPMQQGDLGYKLGPNHAKKTASIGMTFHLQPNSPRISAFLSLRSLSAFARWRWKTHASSALIFFS